MKIQVINSYKPMMAGSPSWNTGELTALQPQADRLRLSASAGFRKEIKAQAVQNNYATSTMGRDLVSFKGHHLPTISNYLPECDHFLQKGIDEKIAGLKAANGALVKVASKFAKKHGRHSAMDLDALSAKALKKQLKEVVRSIENAFADKAIEKKFLSARINEASDKATYKQLKTLKEGLDEAKGKVDFASAKKGKKYKKALKQRDAVNQQIFAFLEKTEDTSYIGQMARMKKDVKSLIDAGFEILM